MATNYEWINDFTAQRDPSWTWDDKHFVNPRMVAMFKEWARNKGVDVWLKSTEHDICLSRITVQALSMEEPEVKASLVNFDDWQAITGVDILSDIYVEGFSWEDLTAAHIYGLNLPVVGLSASHPLVFHAKRIAMAERTLEPREFFTIRHREKLAANDVAYCVYWPETGATHEAGTDLYEALLVMEGNPYRKCELWTRAASVEDFHAGRFVCIRTHQSVVAESSPVK